MRRLEDRQPVSFVGARRHTEAADQSGQSVRKVVTIEVHGDEDLVLVSRDATQGAAVAVRARQPDPGAPRLFVERQAETPHA